MKTSMLFIVAILFSGGLFAQQVNYTVTHDNANSNPWLVVNVDLFQMDFFFKSLDGMSFNTGVWGHVQPISDKWGGEYNIKKSWLALGQLASKELPGHTELNLGGYFFLRSKLKTGKKTKVVLEVNSQDVLYSPGERVETTTFLMIPGQRQKYLGVHGGFYRKSHGYGFDGVTEDLFDFPHDYGGFYSTGLYAGVLSRSLTNLFIKADGYGTCFNSIGDDFYLDVIISMSNNFKDLQGDDINGEIKPLFDGESPLGFRVGWKRFQIEKKALTGKKFGMSAMFEAGYKPYLGAFLNAGIGITLIKAKK